MVCGKCWKTVSGGVVDGDNDHPYYRYGGLWKNLHKQDKLPDFQQEQSSQPEDVDLEKVAADTCSKGDVS